MTKVSFSANSMDTIPHWIDGAVHIDTKRSQAIYNPATGKIIRRVTMANASVVEKAVSSAQAAFPAWRDTPPIKRARVLNRFRLLLEQHADRICHTISCEHGKVIDDARGELQRGIENVEYACGIPDLLKGEYSKNVSSGVDSWSEFQPLGVVAGITPFNFPAMVPLWMWPLAVACGNTFVLKPSEKDPGAVILIAQLASEAGLPNGVLNVVNGDKEAVDALLQEPCVKAISFVGSTPIAEYIYTTASTRGKRVQALGGAKNHAVVMPDADLEGTADALSGAAYGSCGERCMAISVVVAVGDNTADKLIKLLRQRIAAMSVGQGSDEKNDMGPLISASHREKVVSYIEQGVKDGAELIIDGRSHPMTESSNGYFIGASLFDVVKPHMAVYREEIFGPVLCILRVEYLREAIDLIDAHEYGNGACIYTRDGEAARYFCDTIQVGMVGVNVALPVPVAYHSFGGWKRSLFGDLNAYGPDGVRFYTKRKTVTQRWPAAKLREGTQFTFPGSS